MNEERDLKLFEIMDMLDIDMDDLDIDVGDLDVDMDTAELLL